MKPILRPFIIGEFKKVSKPSKKIQNGISKITVIKNLKNTKVSAPQESRRISAAGKPIAHKNIALKHAKLLM